MTDHHVSNDEFLSHLTTLLSTTHTATHGSIFLSQKRLPSNPDQILIRASNGANKEQRAANPKSKIKFGTIVSTSELGDFYARYADVCKKGMEGLKKRDKKKTKKRKKAGGEKGAKK